MAPDWEPEPHKISSVRVDDVEISVGDRVRLRPSKSADILDIVLAGKTAIVASIEQDYESRIHFAVTVDDDPGQDLGYDGKPGHRFFFGAGEVEKIADAAGGAA